MRPGTRRILCVEDDADSRAMLKALFEREGHEVTCAAGTGEAVRLAEAARFDLFILDARFPEGAGTDLCALLKIISPETDIVFYSGAATASEQEAGLSAGARAYVVKPYVEELLQVVRGLLAR